MIPYPAYKDSGVPWVGEVPEKWGICKLKWVTAFNYGDSLSAQERQGGDVPVYGSNGIIGTHNYAITKSPCIIIGRKGSFGKVNFSDIPCFPIDTTFFVDASTTSHNLYWLAYLLPLLGLDKFSRDSAVPGLNREDAYANMVPVPPLPEQRAIAAYLDRKTAQIDTLIANKRRRRALLAEERTALISHTVTKGLDPDVKLKDSGVEWIGEIPVGWEVRKLKWLADIKLSNVDKKSNEDEPKVLLCNYVDVYYNERITTDIDFMAATARKNQIEALSLKQGDVLITKDSETPDDIAVPAFVPETLPGVVCGYHLAHIRPYCERSDGNYIARSFTANGIRDQFSISANGITRFGISKYTIENALFFVPPLPEQRTIAAYLDRKTAQIDRAITHTEGQIALLQEYRTALISAAVTGKIDVRDDGRLPQSTTSIATDCPMTQSRRQEP